MKDKIFDKIVKKDYNNNLENGYNDYNIIKKDTFDKKEYIQNLINVIDNDCEKIEFISLNSNQKEVIDKEQKKIICKPIEINLLYSISKIRKK